MNAAKLTITRDTPMDVQDRWIRVWLDGKLLGILKYGQTMEAEIAPGQHALKISNTLTRASDEFDAKAGDHIRFRVHNEIGRGGYLSILMLGVATIRVKLERLVS